MLKLMIVDDEYFVRRGIIESIDWNKYDIEICGEASNGLEALELLENVDPDCILTDIKMGEMDGLEFIAHARKKHSDTIFIILSGYDDFEDARKAITLGVSEYLLKPIGAEELIQTIMKVKEKLAKSNEQVLKHTSSLQNSVMLTWNTPDNTTLSMDHSYFRVFTFHIDKTDGPPMVEISTNTICGIVKEYLNLAKVNHIVKYSDGNFFIVMLNYRKPSEDFSEFLECFTEYLQNKEKISITIGCGEEYTGYHNINQSYNQAFGALGYHYITKSPTIVFSDQIPKALLRNYMYNPELQNLKNDIKILSNFSQLTDEQFHSRLTSLIKKITLNSITSENIKTIFFKLYIMNLNQLHCSADTILRHSKLSCLFDFDSIFSSSFLRSQMEKLYSEITEFENARTDDVYQDLIEAILQYVSAHYGEDISLKVLSQKVHITPNYLSKVFKETLGINFKEWLTQYRIEKSKELLLDPSLKVYEIGTMVGFSDYKHFASVFKKYTGCSAKEYRVSRLKSELH